MGKLNFNDINSYNGDSFEKFETKQKVKRTDSKKDMYRKQRNNKQHDKYISWEE